MKKYIPNTITSMNLLSGAFGVVAALAGYWYLAFWMMVAAAVFDFFDGLAARALKVTSPMGKELDSLADMISFGMLPGAMMYRMIYSSYNLPHWSFEGFLPLLPFAAFFITAMSAIRLAKFNVDTRQSDIFIGLPTPANALFIGGLSLMSHILCHCSAIGHLVGNTYFLLGVTLVFSYLLVAELPMLSLKFKNLGFKENIWRYILISGAVIIIIIFVYWVYMAVSVIILYYIILSILWNMFKKK